SRVAPNSRNTSFWAGSAEISRVESSNSSLPRSEDCGQARFGLLQQKHLLRGKLSPMRLRVYRKRPLPWSIRRQSIKHAWSVPFWAFEWCWEWLAYILGNWSLLEVLEYLGSFGVLVAVVFYFSESGDRLKQKHYQAWQVINTAQGKGGSGGRIDALQE